jgi:hypothetical protein
MTNDAGEKPRSRTRRVKPAPPPAPTTPDPIEMAMEALAAGAEPQGVAVRVLERQARLLGWQIASERAGFALKLLTAAAGLAAAAAFGLMAWEASRANGLVVAGFTAPPAYAARGLSDEVLATDLTNRIAALVRATNAGSLTRTDDVRGDGADAAIKVEIPQTGVSLGEVARYLRGWLGHERRLTAALRDDGAGMASITVALPGADQLAVRGPAGDVDALMNAAAETAFAMFDPENVIIYLGQHGRQADADAAAERLMHAAQTPRDRARAYGFMAAIDPNRARALTLAQLSIRMDPEMQSGWLEGMNASISLAHDEAALGYARGLATRRRSYQDPSVQAAFPSVVAYSRWLAAMLMGDYAEPQGLAALVGGASAAYANRAAAKALQHDPAGAAEQLAFAQVAEGIQPTKALETRWDAASAAGDWPAALGPAQALVRAAGRDAPPGAPLFFSRQRTVELPTKYRPWLALAEARTGDVAGARALAAMGPLDCYLCVRVRGQVAEAAGDRAGADRWFAEAVRQGPSLPFADLEWGQAELARGDVAGATAAFSRSHALSPQFADPLEAWGEALAAAGDTKAAAGKYAAADRIAPQWGRLHLKWGEALAKAGRADEARAQFRTAARLYLSGPDRAELAAQRS